MGKGDQGIAMHPQETIAEFPLQFLQGIGNDQLGIRTAGGHILLVGEQAAHLLHRHGGDTAVGVAHQPGAQALGLIGFPPRRRAASARLRQGGKLHTVDATGTRQGPLQFALAHGLEQVGHRLVAQGLQGVFIIGGTKNHRRWLLQGIEVGRQLDTVHARHANIQQEQVRVVGLHQFQRLLAAGGLPAPRAGPQLPHQAQQALPGQAFIVHHQDIHTSSWVG